MKLNYFTYKRDDFDDPMTVVLGYNFFRSHDVHSKWFPKPEGYKRIHFNLIIFDRAFNFELIYGKYVFNLNEAEIELYLENKRKTDEFIKKWNETED
jgi:hypothetical protein